MALLGVRVAPGDRRTPAGPARDEVLDQAAARREVEHVVLVDRRRREQQRDLAHLLGLRRVLDAARRPRCAARPCPGVSGEVLADRELRSCRPSRAGAGSRVAKLPRAAHQVRAALSTLALMHGRVRPAGSCVGASASSTLPAAKRAWRSARQSSARCRRSARRRSRRRRGRPAAAAGSSQLDSQAGSAKRRSRLPGRTVGAPAGDAGQLGAQVPDAARGPARPARRARRRR